MDWFVYDRDLRHEGVKGRIFNSAVICENMGKRKPLFWQISSSVEYQNTSMFVNLLYMSRVIWSRT